MAPPCLYCTPAFKAYLGLPTPRNTLVPSISFYSSVPPYSGNWHQACTALFRLSPSSEISFCGRTSNSEAPLKYLLLFQEVSLDGSSGKALFFLPAPLALSTRCLVKPVSSLSLFTQPRKVGGTRLTEVENGLQRGTAVPLMAPLTLISPTVAVLLCATAWSWCPSLSHLWKSIVKAHLKCHIPREHLPDAHCRCCLPPSAP